MRLAFWKKYVRQWKLNAVERYYFALKDNEIHPFENLGDGFYYLLLRSDKFHFGLGAIAISIACFVAFSSVIGVFSFPFVLFLFAMGYGIFCVYGNTSAKELIIARHAGYVLRIKGSRKVIVEEPINNIYIKLQRKYDTNNMSHYFLILGGYLLDDIRLTGFSNHDGPFRILGAKVAQKLGMNFFDVDNNSIMHRIIHYPTRSLIKPPSQDFERFLDIHNITDEQISIAKRREGISTNSDQVPASLMKRIARDIENETWDWEQQGATLQSHPHHNVHQTKRSQHQTLKALIEAQKKRGQVRVQTIRDDQQKRIAEFKARLRYSRARKHELDLFYPP